MFGKFQKYFHKLVVHVGFVAWQFKYESLYYDMCVSRDDIFWTACDRFHYFNSPTCTMRILRPVSFARPSRIFLHGLGVTSNDALNARLC